VKGILADNDVRGQVEYLVMLMQVEPWREFWEDLGLALFNLEDLGLSPTSSDKAIVVLTRFPNFDEPESSLR
jgi:hypothetical protein